jgi:uncharacterized phage-associated protein
VVWGRFLLARDVREVANAILSIAEDAGFRISNAALNKIVYFAHGWHLAINDAPLVDSAFEAWQFGPVHPQIYRQLKGLGNKSIRRGQRLTEIDLHTGDDKPVEPNLSDAELQFCKKIVLFYGKYSASRLIQISHEPGAPWDQVWEQAGRASLPGMVISDTITKGYYQDKQRNRS